MKKILLFSFFIIQIVGCGKKAGNDRTYIKYIGAYTGVIPCADCPGINYEIILNEDLTYLETKLYLGRNVKPIQASGKWELEDKNTIKLFKQSDEFSLFEYSDKNLIMLGADGKKIEGPTADKFVLKPGGMQIVHVDQGDSLMNSSDPLTLKGVWTLIELNGQKTALEDFRSGYPELEINETDSKFYGSSGCNRINGVVQISGEQIGFSKFFSTKMECPGTIESEFISSLRSVDAYKIEGRILSLYTAGKTVLKYTR